MSTPTTAIKLLAHQWIQEIWNRGNLSLVEELCTKDCVLQELGTVSIPEKIDSTKAWFEDLLWAFPDLRVSTQDEVVDKSKIAIRYKAQGTFTKELRGIRATGDHWSWDGIMIMSVRQVKIQRLWTTPNRETLLWWFQGGHA